MRALFALLICSFLLPAYGVEPGLRLKGGVSGLKLLGKVGDHIQVGGADFTVGGGGYADVSYRMQESFSIGVRGSWYTVGISNTDKQWYDSASLREILFIATLIFNPDEDARPFAAAGLGLSWLGWQYAAPHPVDGDPTFVINDDRRRASTFLFSVGAEVALGEYWELIPALNLRLHGWADHTYQGVVQADPDDEETSIAPTTTSLEITVGLARRF